MKKADDRPGILRSAPFTGIIIPAVTGIIAANTWDFPWWTVITGVAVCYILAWLRYKEDLSEIYLFAALFLTFLALGKASLPGSVLPLGEKAVMVARITCEPSVSGRWQASDARITAFRHADDTARQWHKTDEKIFINTDTSYHISAGEEFSFTGYVNPVGGGSYGKLMARRGYSAMVYLTPGNMIRRSPKKHMSPVIYAGKMRSSALKKMDRLGLSATQENVASAMTLGWKRSMTPELKEDYRRAGASHLLAVSGLHVGIVFSLINIFLWLLPAVRRGHIAKNIAAIALIWLYAAVTGLSPSVVRSALMFSGAQIALATTSHRQPVNILFATAFIMLALNPNNLYDISFLLSLAAVFFILLWFFPLYGILRTRWKILNALISVIIIGVVATVGTAPLSMHTFGYISLAGIIINPAVILTAHIIVFCSLLWIIIPVPLFAPAFRWVIGFAADVQNACVSWSASQQWASAEMSLPLWAVFAIYTLFMLTVFIPMGGNKEKELTLPT